MRELKALLGFSETVALQIDCVFEQAVYKRIIDRPGFTDQFKDNRIIRIDQSLELNVRTNVVEINSLQEFWPKPLSGKYALILFFSLENFDIYAKRALRILSRFSTLRSNKKLIIVGLHASRHLHREGFSQRAKLLQTLGISIYFECHLDDSRKCDDIILSAAVMAVAGKDYQNILLRNLRCPLIRYLRNFSANKITDEMVSYGIAYSPMSECSRHPILLIDDREQTVCKPSQDKAFRVAVLGLGPVGKTSLIQRYVLRRFEENLNATIAAYFLRKEVQLRSAAVRTLQLWDISGHISCLDLSVAFLRDIDCILICFDLTSEEGLSKAAEALAVVRPQVFNYTPVIIVGLKCDLRQGRKISYAEGLAFAKKVESSGYFETSAKENIGIEELFTATTAACAKESLPPAGLFPTFGGIPTDTIQFEICNRKLVSQAVFSQADPRPVKIVVWGARLTGKTQLIRRFVGENFESQMHSLSEFDWSFACIRFPKLGNSYRLIITEIIQKNYFFPTTPQHFRGTDAAIICFDVTKQETTGVLAEYFCDIRDANLPGFATLPIILLGLKADLSVQRAISYENCVKLAESLGAKAYIEVSAKDNTNVDQAFLAALQACLPIGNKNQPIPPACRLNPKEMLQTHAHLQGSTNASFGSNPKASVSKTQEASFWDPEDQSTESSDKDVNNNPFPL